MQPYLYYGFGFKSEDLPTTVRQRLIDGADDTFTWFTEDDAGSVCDHTGIFYIKCKGPWDEGKDYTNSHCMDLDALENFKNSVTDNEIDRLLEKYELSDFKDKLKFYVSVTEI